MSYGKLITIASSMFSGKTTELICQHWKNTELHGMDAVCFKPIIDTRYDHHFDRAVISTHSLKSLDATPIADLKDIPIYPASEPKLYIFDEMQFFMEPMIKGNNFVDIIQQLLYLGHTVVCSGLDMDYQGKPWKISAELLAMADQVIKPVGVCSVCGKPANKTYKHSGSDAVIDVGESDKYEIRCNDCWTNE